MSAILFYISVCPLKLLDFFGTADHAQAMNVECAPAEIVAFRDQHRQRRDLRACDQIHYALLSAQGWSLLMIAWLQLIDKTAVLLHLTDYFRAGKRTTGNEDAQEHLSPGHSAKLHQLPTDIIHIIITSTVSRVRDCFGVYCSIPDMNKWFHRNGMSHLIRELLYE